MTVEKSVENQIERVAKGLAGRKNIEDLRKARASLPIDESGAVLSQPLRDAYTEAIQIKLKENGIVNGV